MNGSKNPYQQILKATSIFGGVQLINIIISIIRSKVIALFIGPLGMGISGLLNSTLNIINELVKMGLDTAAVKEIAYSDANEQNHKLSTIIIVLKRIAWLIGILGFLLMLSFSNLFSRLAFGNTDYTFAFAWISIALLLKQLTMAQLTVLQGLRKLKLLANANIYGSILGLVITVPIYYFFRIEGIVPAIILTGTVNLSFSTYFSKQVKFQSIKVSNKEIIIEGKQMLKLGIPLCFMGVLTILSAYLVQIFISNYANVNEVGFYTAGFIIINSYVGMIFNAMQTDYFPRLSSKSDQLDKIREIVNQQAFIGVLLITPVIVIFLTVAPIVITILYSKEFLSITGMVSWGIMGTLFKAVSWSLGYVILAKGDSKLFLKTTIIFNLLFLVLLVSGYILGALTGVGIAFLIYYFIHFLGLRFITHLKYDLYFDSLFNRVFVFCIIICGLTFLMSLINNLYLKYSLMGIMDIVSITFVLFQLNKKINIKKTIKSLWEFRK